MKAQSTTEYQELDLAQAADLVLFQESAKAVFDEASQLVGIITGSMQSDTSVLTEPDKALFISLVEKNNLLHSLVHKCKVEYLPYQEELPVDLIDKMQQLYDDLILLRNSILLVQIEHGRTSQTVTSPNTSITAFPIKHEIQQNHPENVTRQEKNLNQDKKSSVMLCGLTVPAAGIEGLKQVHTMREVLLLARDKHPGLVHDAEKQLLVDTLFRKLANVSNMGLHRVSDIPEIISLMLAINIPVNVVPEKPKPIIRGSNNQDSYGAEDDEVENYVPERRRKKMTISSDAHEMTQRTIAIKITKEAVEETEYKDKELEARNVSKTKINFSPLVRDDFSAAERSVVGKTESIDPINAIIEKLESLATKTPDLRSRKTPADVQGEASYKTFLKENFGSVEEFGKVLNQEVARIESLTEDRFGGWLGEKKDSPFLYLQDMLVSEVVDLINAKGLREHVQEKNIKYETMLTWIDLLPQMQAMVEGDSAISFGELFTYWVIESEMEHMTGQVM
jgi:hypothetical protein